MYSSGPRTTQFSTQDSGYVNGVAGVAASLDSTGNLVIQSFGTRQIYLQFDEPLPPFITDPSVYLIDPDPSIVPSEADTNAAVSVAGVNVPTLRADQSSSTGVALQDLPIGGTSCIRIALNFAGNPNVGYRLVFQRTNNGLPPDQNGNDQDGTAWGIVTRVDANTWTVEPGPGGCSPVASLPANGSAAARLVRGETVTVGHRTTTTTTNSGRFNMPFKMTLRRQA